MRSQVLLKRVPLPVNLLGGVPHFSLFLKENCRSLRCSLYFETRVCQVPYRVLNFLTSYINYGGRVTDYIDLRTIDVLMRTFYTPRVSVALHSCCCFSSDFRRKCALYRFCQKAVTAMYDRACLVTDACCVR